MTLAALGATACGGVALRVGDGGANGGQGGSGQGGTGQGGGGGSTPVCNGLDEATCAATQDCQAQHCQVCPSAAPMYAGCATPGAPVACPAESCVQQTCGGLDETSCKGRGDCSAAYCPDCKGGQAFVGCDSPAEGATVCADGCPSPPACNGLDEMACLARGDCHPGYCGCPGEQTFSSCLGSAESLTCGIYSCPNEPPSCADITIPAECDSRTDCHSVFIDKPICDCAVAGCCASFSRCADGGKASCTGAPACQILTPYCEGPAYVISYTASCYEGCVRPSECGP